MDLILKKVWGQTVSQLKEEKSVKSINTLTGLFGKTRQAYYKSINKGIKTLMEETIVLEMVKNET